MSDVLLGPTVKCHKRKVKNGTRRIPDNGHKNIAYVIPSYIALALHISCVMCRKTIDPTNVTISLSTTGSFSHKFPHVFRGRLFAMSVFVLDK